jgi:predicted peptidase
LSINYNLYIPEWEWTYPLYVFIGDASTVWDDATKPLTQWIWWIIWATEEDQAKHPCYIAIPQFPTSIVTDTERSEYVDLVPRFIEYLKSKYSISNVYEAWQSMWAMTTLYLSANNPWLYSAVLIVDGQWDVSEIQWIKDQTFTYFAAEWDDKAYAWLQAVKAMFDEAGIAYWELSWLNANEEYNEENNAKLSEMYNQWYKQNFVTWEEWTVLEWEWWMEHMASFKHGFKLPVVRDWLFSN